MKHVLLLFFAFLSCSIFSMPKTLFNTRKKASNQGGVDIIICTYDRPLQLEALLKSINYYFTGVGSIFIIARISDPKYLQAYIKIGHENPEVIWLLQANNLKHNFKACMERAFDQSTSEHYMFAVDDLIVKDYADLQECCEYIKKYDAYGFYLRQGLHLTKCHTKECDQQVPPYVSLSDTIISWNFCDGEYDWCCPAMMDMAILPVQTKYAFKKLAYKCPNSFERAWRCIASHQNKGLCFIESKAVNIPINLVQEDGKTPNMALYTPQELLDLFNNGLEIDFKKLYNIKNKAGHIDWSLHFMPHESRACKY